METLNYETVRSLVDKYFESMATTFITDNGMKCIIDTRDPQKIDKFFGGKFVDYLAPGRAGDSETLKNFGAYQALNENDLNTMLRTPEMFFEAEINLAKEYQSYFTEFRKEAEHLLYYTILQDWIDFLKKRFADYTANEEGLGWQKKLVI